jgi:adenylate cyclase
VLGRLTGKGHRGRPSTAPGDVTPISQPPQPASSALSPPIFGLPRPPPALESPKSPMEPVGKRYELDTDLNDMEGIVDMSHLQSFSGPYSPAGPPVVPISVDKSSGRPITPSANTSSSAAASHPGRLSATSSAVSEGSTSAAVTPIEQADSPFQPQNPFFPIMDNASGVPVQLLPSSPQITLQKQSIASTQSYSRRPSQLRQVESLVSNASPSESDFTPTPRRSESGFGDPFNGPTDASKATEPAARKRPNMRLDLQPNTFSMDAAGFKALSALTPDMMSPGTQMQAFRLTPLSEKGSTAAQAAWQAPESWGVEGDEEPEDAASSDEADDLPDTSHDLTVDEGSTEQPIVQKVVPPFGYNSGMKRQRPHTGNTSRSRPTTEGAKLSIATRPGTSGSNHANVTVSQILASSVTNLT